jgi:hypothetical protein
MVHLLYKGWLYSDLLNGIFSKDPNHPDDDVSLKRIITFTLILSHPEGKKDPGNKSYWETLLLNVIK